jgi:predicted DNA-binding transcriptional regulator AlpA
MATRTNAATEWLRSRDLLLRFGISDVTLWRWVKAGKFPAPTRLGGTRSLFWARGAIESWEAARREAQP